MYLFISHLFVYLHIHACAHGRQSKDNRQPSPFPSIMWVPGIGLRASGLAASTFTQWVISTASPNFVKTGSTNPKHKEEEGNCTMVHHQSNCPKLMIKRKRCKETRKMPVTRKEQQWRHQQTSRGKQHKNKECYALKRWEKNRPDNLEFISSIKISQEWRERQIVSGKQNMNELIFSSPMLQEVKSLLVYFCSEYVP